LLIVVKILFFLLLEGLHLILEILKVFLQLLMFLILLDLPPLDLLIILMKFLDLLFRTLRELPLKLSELFKSQLVWLSVKNLRQLT
jgi:hypothetical protein